MRVTAGDNGRGNLGLGDNEDRGDDDNEMGDFLPAVSLGLTATEIGCGDGHTCAFLSNGQLKCWGGFRIFCYPRCQGTADTSLI